MKKADELNGREVLDFIAAKELYKKGGSSTLGEAVDRIKDWRNKQAAIKNLPPEKKAAAIKAMDATWNEMIPRGSTADKELFKGFRETMENPEEMERVREEMERLRKELARIREEREQDRERAEKELDRERKKRERAEEELEQRDQWLLSGEEPIPPDFEVVKKMDIVLVDPEASKLEPYIIPDTLRAGEKILDQLLEDGSRILKYRKVYYSHRITYTWIIPPELAEEEIPTIGAIARKVLNFTYAFYTQQRRNGPKIVPGEMLELLDLKGKGGQYTQLYNIYRTLAYGTYEIEHLSGRKWIMEEISSVLSVRFERGKNKRKIKFIRPYLSEFIVEELNLYLSGKEGGRYIGKPMNLLKDGLKGYSKDIKNFTRQIYSYRNLRRPVTIQYKKLFGDPKWLGWTKKKLDRARAADLRAVHEDIIQAIKDLNLGTYEMDPASINVKKKNELLNWKMIFKASSMLRLRKEQFKFTSKQSAKYDIIDNIADWHCQSEFRVNKVQEEVREQVSNTVDKYGSEVVSEIFESSENPREFWNQIKEIKRQKKNPDL